MVPCLPGCRSVTDVETREDGMPDQGASGMLIRLQRRYGILTEYQETLDERWNDTARRVASIEKRLDVMSEKFSREICRIDKWLDDEKKRRRSVEF